MGKILIDIKDKSKENIVVSLLRELSFIEVKELGKASKIRRTSDFQKLFELWKGRKITIDDLRRKAWQRKTS